MKRLAAGLLLLLAGPCAAKPSTFSFGCDARVDVLGVVQTLAGWRAPEPRLPPSMAGLEERFKAHKEHPAVRRYRAAADRLEGREPYALILSALTQPPALAWTRPHKDISLDFIRMAGGDEELDAFLADLRDFTRVSGVLPWLESHRGECAAAEREAGRELAGRHPPALIERYLGRPLDARLRLVLSLIYTPRTYSHYIVPYPFNHGAPIPRGPYSVFTLLRYDWDETGRPVFGLEEPFRSDSFMELYYIAAEPASLRWEKELESFSGRRRELGGSCHGNWHTCSLFIIVSAINHRLAALHGSEPPTRGDDPTSAAILRLERLLEQDYEPGKASGRYASIDAFWPRLIDALGPPSPAR
jgi:hypothetical protein